MTQLPLLGPAVSVTDSDLALTLFSFFMTSVSSVEDYGSSQPSDFAGMQSISYSTIHATLHLYSLL
jgi:hypothetical protein